MASKEKQMVPGLRVLDTSEPHTFIIPSKKINELEDMSSFWVSYGYRDIMTFLMQLNHSMFPLKLDTNSDEQNIKTFEIDDPGHQFPETIIHLRELLTSLDKINDEVELDTGPRRFGNVSFRKWFELLEARSVELLNEKLPPSVVSFDREGTIRPVEELKQYLIGSFGSSQRLDYGTGHELSFLAFLGGIWKLGGFGHAPNDDNLRDIVIGVIHPYVLEDTLPNHTLTLTRYLMLIRKLILRYSLEPAGSHGVWGLDDHSFLPYVFGSAQYGPAISPDDPVPTEGSLKGATDPGNIVKARIVEKERQRNLYFGAIGFIYDVKKGPFWEHSPTLYDISGVKAGWGKINKGMVKMYDAEVLGKFPVVQHFPFGSLFSFDRDPNAKPPASTAHTMSQPSRSGVGPSGAASSSMPSTSMQAPWSQPQPALSGTQAPWASRPMPQPPVSGQRSQPRNMNAAQAAVSSPEGERSSNQNMPPPTKAPWAK